MGIHSGPVNEVRDVNGRANVAGAGINIAQRVMDCGDDGHILLSKRVAEDLSQSRQWRPWLHDLGECAIKHSVPISIVNLYTDEIGNAQLPERVKQWQSEQAAQAADDSPSIFRRTPLLIAASALLTAVGQLWRLALSQTSGSDVAFARENHAVLHSKTLARTRKCIFCQTALGRHSHQSWQRSKTSE